MVNSRYSSASERPISERLRFSALFEQAHDAVFIIDTDQRIVRVNPAGCTLLRYKAEEIVGKNYRDFLMEGEHAQAEERYQSVAAGRYVEISFSDKGSGIPNENLPRIFDPYFTTRRNGSGLGLATAYAVVRKHGGLITVDSVEGRGSRFVVSLPATSLETTRHDEEWKPTDHDGRRVLLMDDEEVVRTTVDMMLSDPGFDVVTAAEGGAAIEAYRDALEGEEPFDLVILDLSVPHGLGGIPTLQRLKEIQPDVRAIVASGYSTDSVLADCESYGFSGRLAKPFRIADLDKELQRVLTQRASIT